MSTQDFLIDAGKTYAKNEKLETALVAGTAERTVAVAQSGW